MATKKKPTQLDRIEAKLSLIESSIAVIRSGATFMQEMDKNARQLQDMKEIGEKWDAEEQGLKAGDYTSGDDKMSLKEVADALTAMGFEWSDKDRFNMKLITWHHPVGGIYDNRMFCTPASQDTYLDPATFLRRAAVTAKEIGLVPVEPWVPKVGDWVVVTSAHHHPAVPLCSVVKVKAEDWVDGLTWDVIGPDGNAWPYTPHNLRPATDADVAAHLAEQEAMKPVVFGTRVEYQGDRGFRVVCDNEGKDGWWSLSKPSTGAISVAKRHEFTVIDPQP